MTIVISISTANQIVHVLLSFKISGFGKLRFDWLAKSSSAC